MALGFARMGGGFSRLGGISRGTPPPTGPPVNLVAPVVTGTLTQGQTLTSTDGTWTNSPSLTREWYRVVPLTTWDTATTTNVALSNGNLTATHSNTTNNSGARSIAYKNSGLYYFEVSSTKFSGGDAVGIVTSAGTYTNVVTNGTNCAVTYCTSGNIYSNGGNSTLTLGAWGTTSTLVTIGIAVDLNNEKVWFRVGAAGNWNGQVIGSQNPATNTGGASISTFSGTSVAPVVGFGAILSSFLTANFGGSAFVGAVPSGFTSGWPA